MFRPFPNAGKCTKLSKFAQNFPGLRPGPLSDQQHDHGIVVGYLSSMRLKKFAVLPFQIARKCVKIAPFAKKFSGASPLDPAGGCHPRPQHFPWCLSAFCCFITLSFETRCREFITSWMLSIKYNISLPYIDVILSTCFMRLSHIIRLSLGIGGETILRLTLLGFI